MSTIKIQMYLGIGYINYQLVPSITNYYQKFVNIPLQTPKTSDLLQNSKKTIFRFH